jgi:hypothetical protein
VPRGVADGENCLCNSCQPFDALVVVNHPCVRCDDSFSYLKDAQQTRLSEQEAQKKDEDGRSAP